MHDIYPAVLQTRRIDDPKATFFGPFPNIGDVRRILKTVRRIFPYQSVRNHPKRICLYHHLGLCPCPQMLAKEELTKYRRTIRYVIQFLEGKKESVMRALEKEMKEAAKGEHFEEAELAKQQIDTIRLITSGVQRPWSYIENPKLVLDEAKEDLESLRNVLAPYFRGLTPKSLQRIECYDISNIGGKEATGSMVVATDGQIDKSQYRRFRIRFKNTPDDTAMHKEMLTRRLKHPEWQFPDLIVIDGGVGQVHRATSVVEEKGLSIPVIGLAKRLEEIVFPGTQGETLERKRQIVRLPRDHRALKLLQLLRDEAHRFALAYHRNLRRKRFLPS
jgi:excinuclease ABC subunit C